MSTIVHVTAPADFGGLERVVTGLSIAMVRRGHRIIVVTVLEPDKPVPPWALSLRDSGIVVEPIHVHARAYCTERRLVRELLLRYEADVVHTHGNRTDFVDGTYARRAGYPVVSTAHGFIKTTIRGRFYNRLQIRAMRRFDAVVAVSRPLLDELRAAGVSSDRLVQISNGLVPSAQPLLSQQVSRERLSLPSSSFVIGWVGRFSAEKGPDIMVEAFRSLGDDDAVLCMLGNGPELNSVRSVVERLGLAERVWLPGSIPDAQALLRAFDVLALSSRTEGLPMVLLEAASAEVPVVASAVGGIPALLGAGGGLQVPPGDPPALAAALGVVKRNGAQARDRASMLALQVRNAAEKDDWIDRYEELYGRLISNVRPTTHPS